ncbi:hypothetical protein ACFL5N_02085 [bacterium]
MRVIKEPIFNLEILEAIKKDKILIAKVRAEEMLKTSAQCVEKVFLPIAKDLGFAKFFEIIVRHKQSMIDFQLPVQQRMVMAA